MLSRTSLKFSAVVLGLMLMVGCQSQNTAPTAEWTSPKTLDTP